MPDDPRDTSTTENSTPTEPAPRSPWPARPSLPSAEDVPPDPEAEETSEGTSRARSIFNRFRRGRMTPEDLQTRLMFGEEKPSEMGTDDAPAIAPARVPIRRPAAEDPANSPPPAPAALPSPPPAGSRPTPPIEAILAAQETVEAGAAPEPASEPAVTSRPVTPWMTTPGTLVAGSPPDRTDPATPPEPAAPLSPVAPWLATTALAAGTAPAKGEEETVPAQPEPELPAIAGEPPTAPWIAESPSPELIVAATTPDEPAEATPAETSDAGTVPTVDVPPPATVTPVARPIEAAEATARTSMPAPVTASRFEAFKDETGAASETSTVRLANGTGAERKASPDWAAFRPIPVPLNPYMLLLSALGSIVMLAYLLVEPSPRGFLILGAAVVAAGLDGTLRATWRVTYAGRETTAALFMPAIFVLAVPPLIEHNVRGLAVLPAGLAAGLAFFAIVAAQVGSARPGASYYPWARTVSTAGAYAAGFAFFSLTYVFNLGVVAAALATGLVTLMLAIEVLREGEIDSTETVGYAAAAGAAVGQWRLALHYLPVDGYLAGLAVLLGFLLVTGLLQAYITRGLNRRATIDHAVVAFAGAVLVVGARVAGLA